MPVINKKIVFSDKYRNTLAFRDAMTVIKACGLVSFYDVLCDIIIKYINSNYLMHASSLLDDLVYLKPKPTNVNKAALENANKVLENTITALKLEGYDPNISFDQKTHSQQVFFCLSSALSFLTIIQKAESEIHDCESNVENETTKRLRAEDRMIEESIAKRKIVERKIHGR